MAYSETYDIRIAGLASAVPETILDLEARENDFGQEAVEAARKKYGTREIRISPREQTASDLGFAAASQILGKKQLDPTDIGAIVFVSLTQDYRSPATATVLHYRLGLSVDCMAFDLILGANGFVQGLQAVSSLLAGINKPYALLITGDTPSKQLPENSPLSLRYGDGAAAILLEKNTGAGNIATETWADGEGFSSLIIPGGGFRFHNPLDKKEGDKAAASDFLKVDDQAFRNFVIRELPGALQAFLSKRNTSVAGYDFMAFHEAGTPLMGELAGKLDLDPANLPSNASSFGNTSGNSIPLLLCDTFGKKDGQEIRVLACAFGEGFSWGLADFRIQASDILPVIETNDFFREGEVSHDF